LTCARADAITGSTLVIVCNRSPFWGTGRHARNSSGSQDHRSRIYRGARARRPPGPGRNENPRPIDSVGLAFSFLLFVIEAVEGHHHSARISTLVLIEFECAAVGDTVRAALKLLFSHNPCNTLASRNPITASARPTVDIEERDRRFPLILNEWGSQ
jgi:hypothetical protein